VHFVRSSVVEHMRHLGRAGNRDDPGFLCHQPGQGNLSGCRVLPMCPFLDLSNERNIPRSVVGSKPRTMRWKAPCPMGVFWLISPVKTPLRADSSIRSRFRALCI
jgi:hypothetical protein